MAEDDWTTCNVSWQQKIFDRETISAAKESEKALERHLRTTFCAPSNAPDVGGDAARGGGGGAPPDHALRRLEGKYKEALLGAGGAVSRGDQGYSIYTIVDYEHVSRLVGEGGEADAGMMKGSVTTSELAEARWNKRRDKQASEGRALVAPKAKDARTEASAKPQSMMIIADLEGEHVILAQFRAFESGALEMRPGFSDPASNGGKSVVFLVETPRGALAEYVLENASAPRDAYGHHQRTKERSQAQHSFGSKRGNATAMQAAVKKPVSKKTFNVLQNPNKSLCKLTLLFDIVGGKGYKRDNLYVEYLLHLPNHSASSNEDAHLWSIANESASAVQGVTHVASSVEYDLPAKDASTRSTRIVNWSYPIEIDLTLSKPLSDLEPKELPVFIMAVFSYDEWDRSTCEGYAKIRIDGSMVVSAWRSPPTASPTLCRQPPSST